MQLAIDDRERNVIPYFAKYANGFGGIIPHQITRLTQGDYAIYLDDKIIAIFERKTWADLAQSMTSKTNPRIENINKLIEVRRNTNCKLYLIIEGKAFPNPAAKVQGIQYDKLESKILSLMLKDDIYVIHTKDQENTAYKLCKLLKLYQKYYDDNSSVANSTLNLTLNSSKNINPTQNANSSQNITPTQNANSSQSLAQSSGQISDKGQYSGAAEVPQILTTTKGKTIEEEVLLAWKSIPGITTESAKKIINKGLKLSDFFLGKIDKKAMSDLGISAIAITMIFSWDPKYYGQKVLITLNRITKPIAELILEKFPIEKLHNLTDLEIKELSNVKVGKQTVGQARVKKIMDILNYQYLAQ